MNRYKKNIDEIFSQDLQKKLLTKNIGVIGCGGQGGYILEFLIRLGVKSISFWDGDIFEETNLNRQIGCTQSTLGKNKAIIMKKRLQDINSHTILYCKNWYFGDKPSDIDQISKMDIIFLAADCYYNIKNMRNLLRQILLKGIPIINCPINFLGGYVTISTKTDIKYFDCHTQQLIDQSLRDKKYDIISQPAYKCALIAAEAVNQMIQYFQNCRHACINSILNIDIYHHIYKKEDQYGEF